MCSRSGGWMRRSLGGDGRSRICVITQHGELVADIPNQALTDDAPVYHRPVGTWKAPVPLDPPAWVLEELKKPRDYTADLKKLLASANICDKRWVFEQYDSMVQTNTVQGPGGEAGVMRIKGTGHPAMHTALGTLADDDAGCDGFAPFGEESRTWSRRRSLSAGLAMALAGNGRWTISIRSWARCMLWLRRRARSLVRALLRWRLRIV